MNVIDSLIEAMNKANVKVTFGLQPHHIERIESEIKRFDEYLKEGDLLENGWIRFEKTFWDRLGKEFGWCPFTLALHYFEYTIIEKNK